MSNMNPIDVYNKINSALVLWQTHTGKYPARLYLGAQEYAALETMSKMFASVKANDKTKPKITFCGMNVYQVVEESHVSFGWDGLT